MNDQTDATIRTIIVDDEPLAVDALRLALEPLDGIEVVATCVDGVEAVETIRTVAPDLVFLDVQMPDLDGFDVIDRVGADRMPVVVFVTAYDEHALRAFEVHAVDYLLKPFDDERFEDAVRHAVSRVRERRRTGGGGRLDDSLASALRRLSAAIADDGGDVDVGDRRQPAAAPTTRLLVRERERMRFVEVDDVDYFEAAGNYVRLHVGDASHLIRTTLAELETRLDERRFVRIHRSMIVNVPRVREVQPWGGGDYVALLHDGRQLRISRTFKDNLLKTFG